MPEILNVEWAPTKSEDEELTLENVIAQALGAASVCWHLDSGVFNDVAARAIHDGVMKYIYSEIAVDIKGFSEEALRIELSARLNS